MSGRAGPKGALAKLLGELGTIISGNSEAFEGLKEVLEFMANSIFDFDKPIDHSVFLEFVRRISTDKSLQEQLTKYKQPERPDEEKGFGFDELDQFWEIFHRATETEREGESASESKTDALSRKRNRPGSANDKQPVETEGAAGGGAAGGGAPGGGAPGGILQGTETRMQQSGGPSSGGAKGKEPAEPEGAPSRPYTGAVVARNGQCQRMIYTGFDQVSIEIQQLTTLGPHRVALSDFQNILQAVALIVDTNFVEGDVSIWNQFMQGVRLLISDTEYRQKANALIPLHHQPDGYLHYDTLQEMANLLMHSGLHRQGELQEGNELPDVVRRYRIIDENIHQDFTRLVHSAYENNDGLGKSVFLVCWKTLWNNQKSARLIHSRVMHDSVPELYRPARFMQELWIFHVLENLLHVQDFMPERAVQLYTQLHEWIHEAVWRNAFDINPEVFSAYMRILTRHHTLILVELMLKCRDNRDPALAFVGWVENFDKVSVVGWGVETARAWTQGLPEGVRLEALSDQLLRFRLEATRVLTNTLPQHAPFFLAMLEEILKDTSGKRYYAKLLDGFGFLTQDPNRQTAITQALQQVDVEHRGSIFEIQILALVTSVRSRTQGQAALGSGSAEGGPAQGGPAQGGPIEFCICCLERESVVSLVHGEDAHQCLCKVCARKPEFRNNNQCPVCRREIQRQFSVKIYKSGYVL